MGIICDHSSPSRSHPLLADGRQSHGADVVVGVVVGGEVVGAVVWGGVGTVARRPDRVVAVCLVVAGAAVVGAVVVGIVVVVVLLVVVSTVVGAEVLVRTFTRFGEERRPTARPTASRTATAALAPASRIRRRARRRCPSSTISSARVRSKIQRGGDGSDMAGLDHRM